MGSFNSIPRIAESARIDKNVHIGPGCEIGKNVKIGARSGVIANTDIGDDVDIGENVYIGYNCEIENNVKIGDGCVLGNNTDVGNGAIIGKRVRAGTNCNINGCIGDDAIISSNVDIFPNAKIGNGVKLDTAVSVGKGASILDDLYLEYGVCVERNVIVTKNVAARQKVTPHGIEDAPPGARGIYTYNSANGQCECNGDVKYRYIQFRMFLCIQRLIKVVPLLAQRGKGK